VPEVVVICTIWEYEMNYTEIKERVAAGVRGMKEPPNAFLFVPTATGVEEISEIAGIPIFYTPFIYNTTIDDDVPFIPLWKEPGDHILDVRAFNNRFLVGPQKHV